MLNSEPSSSFSSLSLNEGMWANETEEACVAELLRRTQEFAKFRPDRLRLPIKASTTVSPGDRIQCFHDSRTGYHDWAKVERGRVTLVSWKERDGLTVPPPISTVGDLLDAYAELRINTIKRKAVAAAAVVASKPDVEDESWLDKSSDECFDELERRCLYNAGLRLRLRLPSSAARASPRAGDVLQLFHDRITGFATYARLLEDDKTLTYYFRVYEGEGGLRGRAFFRPTEAFVDVSVGEVLDQHSEIRVFMNGDEADDQS